MIKVVVDTNVVVSANLVDEGPSAIILNLATNRRILMCVSSAVLAEYEEVLRRPRLKLNPAKIDDVLALIRRTTLLVLPTLTLAISQHESDNRSYEGADAAAADYLITGNIAHFPNDSQNHEDHHAQEFP